jgi:hypothetical protein
MLSMSDYDTYLIMILRGMQLTYTEPTWSYILIGRDTSIILIKRGVRLTLR